MSPKLLIILLYIHILEVNTKLCQLVFYAGPKLILLTFRSFYGDRLQVTSLTPSSLKLNREQRVQVFGGSYDIEADTHCEAYNEQMFVAVVGRG